MKRTKKWEDGFEKRYSKAINELQELEMEYNLVKSVEDNETWYKLFPENCLVEFGPLDNTAKFHSNLQARAAFAKILQA